MWHSFQDLRTGQDTAVGLWFFPKQNYPNMASFLPHLGRHLPSTCLFSGRDKGHPSSTSGHVGQHLSHAAFGPLAAFFLYLVFN